MIPGIMRTGRSCLIAATLLLGSLFFVVPTATAQGACAATETFENDGLFQPPSDCWYNGAGMGTAVVSTTRPYLGAKSFDIPASSGGYSPTFVITPAYSACSDGVSTTISWYQNWDFIPTGGVHRTGWQSGVRPVYFVLETTGALTLYSDTSAGTTSVVVPAITIAPDTWYGFQLTVSCYTGAANDDITGIVWEASNPGGTTTGASISDQTKQTADVRDFQVFAQTGFSMPRVWIDNLALTPYDDTLASSCADPNITNTNGVAEADYGYDYRRGGDFFDQEDGDVPGIGLSTGFDYTGSDGTEAENDYSAKHFTAGTKALHQNITIESAEGSPPTESRFRVNFHTQLTTVPDATAKGNGENTGHFADHVEAEFKALESNAWYITFWYVNAGGTRTQIGGSHTFGDSLDATQFTIWLDTRSSANADTTLNDYHNGDWYISGGGSLHADPFILVTTDSAADGPGGEEIAVIGIRYLDDISGNPFLDDIVGDVWNVAGGEIGVAASWHVALDEDNQEGRANTEDEGGLDSTCIFDDAGTLVFAIAGATPGSQNPPPAPTPTPTPTGPGGGLVGSEGAAHTTGNPLGNFIAYQNAAWGFDVSAIFAGIILLACLIAVLIATRGNLFAGMVTVLVVGGIEVSLGLFGVAMIFLLALLCAGFAAGGIFQARNQGGDTA